MKHVASGLLASLLCSTYVLGASLQDALASYAVGDVTSAASIYGDLAARGNQYAQFNMALLFYAGEGVPQNYVEAYSWAWRAKLQGVVEAEALIKLLEGSISNEARSALAHTLMEEQSQKIRSGDGRAMLARAMIQSELLPNPDAIQSYVWQSMAVAVGITEATSFRDETFATLSTQNKLLAQQEAHNTFRDWCSNATKAAPSCTIISN